MTAQSSPTPVVQDAAQANLELAEALREVASWLEAHAGDLPLPRSFGAYIMRSIYGNDAREVLTAVARALGDRATEELSGSEVVITGRFGPVQVQVSTGAKNLGAEVAPQPHLAYEPIIAADPPVTSAEDEAWNARRLDRDDGRPVTEGELARGYGLAVHADELRRRRVPHALKRDLGVDER